MTNQRLDSIEIEGFTSISSARVSLGDLNVLVGANGAGKSNFVRAFEMLGRIVDGELGLFVGFNGGASALLNKAAGNSSVRLRLKASPNAYEAVLAAAPDDELIFDSETVSFQGEGYEKPYLDRLGRGHRETRLRASAKPVADYVAGLLEGCRVFHFHDTSSDAPVKQFASTADNLSLRQDAANLAPMLLALRDNDSAAYRRIVGTVRQVAPFFRDFVLQPENERIRLRWRQNDSDAVFSANQLSDGTLRFICLTTLLLQPQLPMLVVLDEPELGLHPYAIVQLSGLLRQAATRSQVLIATQSVTLMNQFELEDLIVVERTKTGSAFTRPDPADLETWMHDYSLGELWEKNLIGGRPMGSAAHG
ncbi:AAA family ATPase [Kibdelosporangium philippinense]|uniref:AAA family ATPase n=1 Tax=Kibdelosporangium philippinense TaxID=211113 RepID=A0ABS8ZLK0_9PSEU|nr:AAA family ATPase [Kibdelosporangium philippinense]MCE7008447.1 AAA family ATPase [Kibdelosporangium philippinense]